MPRIVQRLYASGSYGLYGIATKVFTFASGSFASVTATHSSNVRLNSLNPPAFGLAVLISNKKYAPSFDSNIKSTLVGFTLIISPVWQTFRILSISSFLLGVLVAVIRPSIIF